MNNIGIVTGGAGFIGSAFVERRLRECGTETIVNVDKMTYAANKRFMDEMAGEPRHIHEKVDVADFDRVSPLLRDYRPKYVVHFAGESHVDRSIANPWPFLHTNIVGTYSLLEAVRAYFATLSAEQRELFRFVHVSTDEVYGSLELSERKTFTEMSPYSPSTPYAATKASSDHLAHAWWKTYGIPAMTVHCSNNYGPRQSPEKLIPKTIASILSGGRISIYGDGRHVRDWIHVEDCCRGIEEILKADSVGCCYNIGGGSERSVLDVVGRIYNLIEAFGIAEKLPQFRDLLIYSYDRLGNDRRYAMDTDKIESELDWRPRIDFEDGLESTVRWYLENRDSLFCSK